jgi:hypothetical protein
LDLVCLFANKNNSSFFASIVKQNSSEEVERDEISGL